MTDYTPTTEEVREAAITDRFGLIGSGSAEAFDRWLAAHDAEIESQALTLAHLIAEKREAEIRADEREKAAQRVEENRWRYHSNGPDWMWHGCPCNHCKTVDEAIAAARGGNIPESANTGKFPDAREITEETVPLSSFSGTDTRGGEQ